jgi:primosomal replication protein N
LGDVNRFDIVARISEVSATRYTPAGLPVVDCQLEHDSTLEEAGSQRKIHLLLKSVAMGTMAEKMIQMPLEILCRFTGFLASTQKSKSVIFHIQSIHTDI